MAYDGSGFHGWQEQKGLRTVQGSLQEALGRLLREGIRVSGTSRTDAGVHALGQCCSFLTASAIPAENLPRALNDMLSPGRSVCGGLLGDLRVLSAAEMPPDFHARFSCRGKTYRYVIAPDSRDIFRRSYSYAVDFGGPGQTETACSRMAEACRALVGRHDFASFRSAGGNPVDTTVRTVYDAEISRAGDGDIYFEISGEGFLYNMVRIITGTLVEIGLGLRGPEAMRDIMEAGDRRLAGHTAPPGGLYLKEIYFDDRYRNRQIQ